MSRFYASIEGSRGGATRQGTPESGIYAHPRGWSLGVSVQGSDVDGKDCFTVRLTGGSNGRRQGLTLAEVTEQPDGRVRIAVESQLGWSVYYLDRDGSRSSR